MFYDKKIKYLDYCENGERISGGGFARTEVREKDFKLYLNVRGVRLGGTVSAKVILCGKEDVTLGQMTLENGQGEFRHECQLEAEERKLSYEDITGIRILLGEDRELKCGWNPEAAAESRSRAEKAGTERSSVAESRAEGKGAAAAEDRSRAEKAGVENSFMAESRAEGKGAAAAEDRSRAEKADTKNSSVAESRTEEKGAAAEGRADVEQASVVKGSPRGQGTKAAEAQSEAGQPSAGEKQTAKTIPLLEDKWRQISAIYPHVQPFQDERDYLSIGPADFVMFTAASYRAANNSFLLHGYYNYKHLILTRVEQRGEILYYLGVPGNYYAREKQVAVIFGFESFECAEEPAQDGDFGYYLMRVQL